MHAGPVQSRSPSAVAPSQETSSDGSSILEAAALASLFDALRRRGYRIIAATARDGAIVYDEVATPADLPTGWTDEQEAGRYRLTQTGTPARFSYAVGPHSWKRFLFPPD